MSRLRLDQLLLDEGFFYSRAAAKAAVLAGRVHVDGKTVTQAGKQVEPGVRLSVDPASRFASRAGEKLSAALEELSVPVAGKVILDSGSSTGGFTDCLLKAGASKVIAVDVGYGILDWRLRSDQRVEVHERTNLRYIRPVDISQPVDLVTLDLSFISLGKVLEPVKACLKPSGELLALVKPQFEVGKGKVGKGGVVRDVALHREALEKVILAAVAAGFSVKSVAVSALRGAKGNVEYWLYAGKGGKGLPENRQRELIDKAIERGKQMISGPTRTRAATSNDRGRPEQNSASKNSLSRSVVRGRRAKKRAPDDERGYVE